ncbi:MAG: cysteine-rich CWC family protein [Chitinophagaceae bacterium]
MCKHEDKNCPRCNAAFECKVGDITKCQCYTVQLNDAERDFLTRAYTDCLCADCMKLVRAAYHQAQQDIQLKQLFGLR